jgi:bacterioferritin-associated ferredoxin
MQADDPLCLCFHVSWRKVINYIRVHRVRVPSQVSQCQGAGTGCGWCRVFIERLVEQIGQSEQPTEDLEPWLQSQLPGAENYARRRAAYIERGKQRHEDDLKS